LFFIGFLLLEKIVVASSGRTHKELRPGSNYERFCRAGEARPNFTDAFHSQETVKKTKAKTMQSDEGVFKADSSPS